MKKFFGILLAAISTLVLLPGCGGGNDNEPTKVTAEEFASGAKMIILQNGFAGWLYITPNKQFPGYNVIDTCDADGKLISQQAPGVVGGINVGSIGGPTAGYIYTCYYDEEGVPTEAELIISTQQSQDGNTTLINFFNQAIAEGENGGGQVVDLRGGAVVKIDFRTNLFTISEQEADANGNNVQVNIGGPVVVQHQ
ncbi:MAG: hypothetical protein E7031_09560 [Akkermansiaceae bacterium]|nr:hypothetical protein [Akkermansiaceae bacterium]